MAQINRSNDLETFAQRLNQALDNLTIMGPEGRRVPFPPKEKGRQAESHKLFGRSQKGCRRWLEGEGWPEKNDWQFIAKQCRVRTEWLFFGEGPMYETSGKSYQRRLNEAIQKAVKTCTARSNMTPKARDKLIMTLYDELSQL